MEAREQLIQEAEAKWDREKLNREQLIKDAEAKWESKNGPWNDYPNQGADLDSKERRYKELRLKELEAKAEGPWTKYARQESQNVNATNLKTYFEETKAKNSPHTAENLWQAIEAGWDISVSGLAAQKKLPDQILPEHAPMYMRIASQVASLAGDLPFMAIGAAGGTAAGTAAGGTIGTVALPVVGTVSGAAVGGVVGGGYGSFALPATLRKIMMDHYEKGDVLDFEDFWSRASSAFIEANKHGAVGAATMGVGGAVGKVAQGVVAPVVLKESSRLASEVATMTVLGKAIEGEMPQPQDFVDAAVLVGGLHASVKVAGKLRRIYSETGTKPAEIVMELQKEHPTLKQELLSDNIELPKVFESPEKAVLSRIGKSEGPKANFDLNKAYTSAVDDLHPIKEMVRVLKGEEPLGAMEDPYVLARLTRGAYGKADQFLENSPFKFETLENVGKSFKEIMKPVEGELDGFRAYALSQRALELNARGIKTGVSLEEARKVVEQNSGKFQKTFTELQEYQDHALTYLKDSGVLSGEAYAKIKEANKNYVPFFRVQDENFGGVSSGLKVQNPVKEIKGSEKLIVDPIESVIKNTYLYITLAEKNRVLEKFVSLAEKSELGKDFVQKVPTPTKPIDVKESEVAQFFKEQGVEATPEAFTIFRPKQTQINADEISFYRQGKHEVYKVNPEVAKAINAMDKDSMGLFFKILSVPASTLRAGSTLAPDFIARNLLRDQLSALNLSKSGYIPFVDAVSGLGSLLKKDSHYQEWLKSGGANAAMVSIDRKYIQENIFKLSQETGLVNSAWNVARSPLEFLRITSEIIENSTRLGEFKKATKNAKTPSDLLSGAFESREVTLDFSRSGAKTRAMNLITAFWNAQIQGLDRTARAFKEDPIGMSAKVTASVTLPSVLLWYANHDDPRWKEIPRWQKDLFWIVMTDEHVYRIPKPFELGIIFGSLPERVLEEYFTNNPDAFKDFGKTMREAFEPGYIPTAALPFIEHFANRSTFTGAPIVSSQNEKLLPEYQYTEYTSESAKMLGKLIGLLDRETSFASPQVLENYINAWSGTMGRYALMLGDQALTKTGIVDEKVKPTPTLADIPFIKAFAIRYPSSSAQSIQDFFENYERNQKYVDTIKALAKQGDFEAMQKEIEFAEKGFKLVSLDGMKTALTNQTRMIQLIYLNPEMSPDEKRQAIDMIYSGMVESARMGNEMFRELEKEE